MRKADRLFQIIQYLRGRRLTTAKQLAEWLEVSERTVYRDISDLMLSGVPIEGEAGVGYVLKQGFDIPPLMFTPEEIEALVVGARIVKAWAGTQLGHAATQALQKIEAVLPERLKPHASESRVFAIDAYNKPEFAANLDQVRQGINLQRFIRFHYTREDGETSRRDVRPLGLFFWGSVWTLGAWCELRQTFRNFRVDRMAEITLLERSFFDTQGMTLNDYLNTVCKPDPHPQQKEAGQFVKNK